MLWYSIPMGIAQRISTITDKKVQVSANVRLAALVKRIRTPISLASRIITSLRWVWSTSAYRVRVRDKCTIVIFSAAATTTHSEISRTWTQPSMGKSQQIWSATLRTNMAMSNERKGLLAIPYAQPIAPVQSMCVQNDDKPLSTNIATVAWISLW